MRCPENCRRLRRPNPRSASRSASVAHPSGPVGSGIGQVPHPPRWSHPARFRSTGTPLRFRSSFHEDSQAWPFTLTCKRDVRPPPAYSNQRDKAKEAFARRNPLPRFLRSAANAKRIWSALASRCSTPSRLTVKSPPVSTAESAIARNSSEGNHSPSRVTRMTVSVTFAIGEVFAMGFLFNVNLRIHAETTLFPRSGCLGEQTTAFVEARRIQHGAVECIGDRPQTFIAGWFRNGQG